MMSRQRGEYAKDDVFQSAMTTLAQSGIYFLQHHAWSASEADDELNASLAVARFIFYAADLGYHVLNGDDISQVCIPASALS